MDAISFVLGIKSSHLRSAQLKDLVYRGRVLKTSKINDDGSAAVPVTNGHANGHDDDDSRGASRGDPKTAWVMAVYEDDAGDEHRWKRTITSQGVSEYRINDRVVTAAEYNAALEAENILIKARNFLVFQGDVEAIASQSPQELTRLIEQISGSLEYKAEYERLEALAEQAAENQNYQLHRRRGINSEIKQYQEQKREAENFQKKTEERDQAVVTHILWKLYHFQRVMDESSARIQEHQEELKEFRRNVEKFERQLDDARRDQAAVGREVGKLDRNIAQKRRDIDDKENSLVPIDEKVEQSTRELESLEKKVEAITAKRDEQAAAIKKIKKDLETVERAEQQFEARWREQVKSQGKELTDADRKEYQALRAQVLAKVAANQTKLESLQRQQQTDEVTVNSLQLKVESYRSAVEKMEADLASIQQRRGHYKASVKETTAKIEAKKKEFNELQSERVRTNQKRTELEENLQEVLTKLAEADDGRRQSNRELQIKDMVATLKRSVPGVRGRVGDLCRPKQKKFEEAVITALGRDFDSVIVDTEKSGADCVQYLKDQRFPPMTFIPLDNIKVNAVNTAVKGIQGVRLTIDTIDFDPSLERAMSYACGSSVVCDTLDIAKLVCYQKGIQVKAVTLEGFVIHKAGLMTGGRGPEQRGGKRRFEEHDVQNLTRMAEKIRDEIAGLPRANRRGSEEEALQNEIAVLQQKLRMDEYELAALDRNHSDATAKVAAATKQLKEFEPRLKEATAALASVQETVKKFRDAISKVEDQIFAGFCKRLGYADIRVYEQQQGTLEAQAAEERSKFEMQKQRLKSRISMEESQHAETLVRIRRMQEQMKRLRQDISGYRAQKATIERQRAADEKAVAEMEARLRDAKERHAEKAGAVAQAKLELESRSKDIEHCQKAINGLEAEVQRNSSGKFGLLRRCKLEQIQIPLLQGSLDDLPNEDNLLHQDADAMDVDGEAEAQMESAMDNYGIEVDFDSLDEDLRAVSLLYVPCPINGSLAADRTAMQPDDESVEEKLQERIAALNSELEKLNPNLRAIERLESVESRLKATEKEFEESRQALKQARDAFNEVKERRFELFNKAFNHIQEQIQHVYKDLTRSEGYPLGGQAYLDIEEDTDTPYLSGIKYHAMPPLKRFRDMEHLSGGEKTMAALALLFAIHSFQPSPFFVLDEVDAALDNANVDKIKKYIREHAGPGMQFIVISLKAGLFQDSESLVGVYRDQEANSSRTLTLDVSWNLFRES